MAGSVEILWMFVGCPSLRQLVARTTCRILLSNRPDHKNLAIGTGSAASDSNPDEELGRLGGALTKWGYVGGKVNFIICTYLMCIDAWPSPCCDLSVP